MTLISIEAELITLVTVYTVEPSNQQKLLDVLDTATVEVMQHLDGFVSANFHKGSDGTSVVNYAQWRNPEAFEAMLANPDAQKHAQEAANLATKVERHLCEVESVFFAPSKMLKA